MKSQEQILEKLDQIFEMKTSNEMCKKCDEKPCNCEDKGEKKGEETNEMSTIKYEMDAMYSMKEMSHKDKYGKMKAKMNDMYDKEYEGKMKDEMAASAERMNQVYKKGVMEYEAKCNAMKSEMDKMYSMKSEMDDDEEDM